jgi:hypothetical protein
MARHLARARHDVAVCNRTRSHGRLDASSLMKLLSAR